MSGGSANSATASTVEQIANFSSSLTPEQSNKVCGKKIVICFGDIVDIKGVGDKKTANWRTAYNTDANGKEFAPKEIDALFSQMQQHPYALFSDPQENNLFIAKVVRQSASEQ